MSYGLDPQDGTSEGYAFTSRERQLNAAVRTAERAQRKIERLLTLPEEPTTDDPDGALVLWFRHQFSGRGTWYTYAAVKAGNRWYLTGKRAPQGITWDALLDWLGYGVGDIEVTLWQADGWVPVG